jgi:hypothetical protein
MRLRLLREIPVLSPEVTRWFACFGSKFPGCEDLARPKPFKMSGAHLVIGVQRTNQEIRHEHVAA